MQPVVDNLARGAVVGNALGHRDSWAAPQCPMAAWPARWLAPRSPRPHTDLSPLRPPPLLPLQRLDHRALRQRLPQQLPLRSKRHSSCQRSMHPTALVTGLRGAAGQPDPPAGTKALLLGAALVEAWVAPLQGLSP